MCISVVHLPATSNGFGGLTQSTSAHRTYQSSLLRGSPPRQMPRKATIEAILDSSSSADPKCVEYLHDELKLYEPFEEVVCRLVENDPSRAKVANDSGSMALHIACGNIENVTTEMLSFLTEHAGETLAIPNKFGLLPIHKAVTAFCTEKSLRNIRFIAEASLQGLSCRTLDGQLPLHLALVSPKVYSYSLVEMLIDLYPPAARVADKRGHYPLHKAASKAHIDSGIVGLLIESAPDLVCVKDHNGYLPLHWALAKDQPSLEVIYLLVAAYPEGLFDPDYEDHLPYDKLIHRSKSLGDIGHELLTLMEFTREQNTTRRLKAIRVPSPNLRR